MLMLQVEEFDGLKKVRTGRFSAAWPPPALYPFDDTVGGHYCVAMLSACQRLVVQSCKFALARHNARRRKRRPGQKEEGEEEEGEGEASAAPSPLPPGAVAMGPEPVAEATSSAGRPPAAAACDDLSPFIALRNNSSPAPPELEHPWEGFFPGVQPPIYRRHQLSPAPEDPEQAKLRAESLRLQAELEEIQQQVAAPSAAAQVRASSWHGCGTPACLRPWLWLCLSVGNAQLG